MAYDIPAAIRNETVSSRVAAQTRADAGPSADQIKQALDTLLATKAYSDIRIQDICDEACLSRKTFSKWFSGKDDIVLEQIRDDFADPVRHVNSELPVAAIGSSTKFMLHKHYQRFFDRRAYYLPIVKDKGVVWLVSRIETVMEQLNREIFAEMPWIDASEAEFGAYFLSAAHAAILAWWISGGLTASIDDVVDLTDRWLYAHQREVDTVDKKW